MGFVLISQCERIKLANSGNWDELLPVWKPNLIPGVSSSFNIPHARKFKREWVLAFITTIYGTVWVDKRYLWFVNGCIEYHRPIITTVCHPNDPRNHCAQRLYPSFLEFLKWVIASPHFQIDHNAPCLPPKICITIVSNFSWELQSSQEK